MVFCISLYRAMTIASHVMRQYIKANEVALPLFEVPAAAGDEYDQITLGRLKRLP